MGALCFALATSQAMSKATYEKDVAKNGRAGYEVLSMFAELNG